MSASGLRAQMANSRGLWRVYVVLFGEVEWPTFEWERAEPVPTLAERAQALARLGYEVAPECCWEWTEDSEVLGDPASRVKLIAAAQVQPLPDGDTP
ncbi:DUF6303 family protein [Streptomyces abikoensis]